MIEPQNQKGMKSLVFFLFFSSFLAAQVSGTIINSDNIALQNVSVFIKNTYSGTITNKNGQFQLYPQKKGALTLIVRSIGYKTVSKNILYEGAPIKIDFTLTNQPVFLEEVSVSAQDNPAHRIVREAIKKRKEHLKKHSHYKANFYSRGTVKINNAPEKFLGFKIGDFEGSLDSTRSGIIYLSETKSKIYQKDQEFKEEVISSKISGDSNGFSFNTASSMAIDFYEKTIEFGADMISPIAENAFNYYRYTLDGTFYDEHNHLINKIKITPKRNADPAFSGFMYIVEDDWALYETQMSATGNQLNFAGMDTMTIHQQYAYSKKSNSWIKTTQYADFEYGIFGFKGNGRFTAIYSDYDFEELPKKKDFGPEVLKYSTDANKRDSIYWNKIRPVPLTIEEHQNYLNKDSLEILKKSKPYLDSIDQKENRFKWHSLFSGYTYSNRYNDWRIKYNITISAISYNTVQGYNGKVKIGYRKNNEETGKYWRIGTEWQYGIAEKKGRVAAETFIRFNKISKPTLRIATGRKVLQFDKNEAISPLLNNLSSLFFKRNFAKFYEIEFLDVAFKKEWWNGFYGSFSLGYEKRMTLTNHSDLVFVNYDDKEFTTNNPIAPNLSGDLTFINHRGVTFSLETEIVFGQKYMSLPNLKLGYSDEKYPRLLLGVTGLFGSSESDYNHTHWFAKINQSIRLRNKGVMDYVLKGGVFDSNNAFMDYYHPKSNETFVRSNGLEKFQMLPFYSRSTNKNYAEFHIAHDFKKWILGKIPLIRWLQSSLETSFHLNVTDQLAPYYETSLGLKNLGFGKYRFFRIDYVRAYQNGFKEDGVVFGFSF